MKIGCVILAGGKSSRMGEDKALLELNGKNFIQQLSEVFSDFEEKLIARGDYASLDGVAGSQIPDIYPGCGPIGGLHASLTMCQSDALFCVSCDMPLLQRSLVNRLCSQMEDDLDAVIAVTENGRIHPLCGIYRKTTVTPLLKQQIVDGNNRMMAALNQLRVKYVTVDEKDAHQLSNINTPNDYKNLKK